MTFREQRGFGVPAFMIWVMLATIAVLLGMIGDSLRDSRDESQNIIVICGEAQYEIHVKRGTVADAGRLLELCPADAVVDTEGGA